MMHNAIKKITEILLFEPFNYKGLRDGVHELHRLFAGASGIKAGNIDDEDVYLPSGKAISSIKAAHCLLEYQRTAVFLRGVYKAILQLKEDFPGERLHILYAGCGPYATLLTPLTTQFTSEELAFHLLDINEASLNAAKKIYADFGLNDYVAEWICTDATAYKLPHGQTRHLMISETMQNALRKEPQVAIMINLIPQLPAKGLFIPEEITISATLLGPRLETERALNKGGEPERVNLGTVYKINKDNCEQYPAVIITLPREPSPCKQLNLLTDITTFKQEKLGIYDCGLNLPFPLFKIMDYTGQRLQFKYRMGETPGFEYNWVN